MKRELAFLSPPTLKKFPRESLDTLTWPPFDRAALGLPSETNVIHARFERLELAITALFDGAELKSTAAKAQITPARLLMLVERCLSLAGDGQIYGFLALVKGCRTKTYVREAPVKPNEEGTVGFAGAFAKLLGDIPEIKQKIDKSIANVREPGSIKMHSASHNVVFQAFSDACKDAGLTRADYPLAYKAVAKRSLRRYVNSRVAKNLRLVGTWHGEGAARRLSLGTGRPDLILAVKPFDQAHIDAHQLDCVSSVEIEGPDGEMLRVSIGRMWLIVVSCAVSNAILGYSLNCVDEVSAVHVEEALLCALTPFKRRELYGDLQYKKDSCLPNGVIPGLHGCPIASLKLDNALVHHSDRIRETVRRALGIHCQFGAVGMAETNARLERLFRTLEGRSGIRRLPSTTGSGAADPLRPKNFVRNAIEEAIDWKYVRDLIEVAITEHNAIPSSTLGNASPRQVIEHYINGGIANPLLRCTPQRHPADPYLGCERMDVRIAGSIEHGVRPYFEILGVRYSSRHIAHDGALIGQKAVVYMDHRTSAIRALYVAGRLIPDIFTKSRKPEQPMSIDDRRAMNSEKDRPYISENMSLEERMGELRAKATAHFRDSPLKLNPAAKEFVAAAMREMAAQKAAENTDEPSTKVDYLENDLPEPVARRSGPKKLAVNTADTLPATKGRVPLADQNTSAPPSRSRVDETPPRVTAKVAARFPGVRRGSFDDLTRRTGS